MPPDRPKLAHGLPGQAGEGGRQPGPPGLPWGGVMAITG